MLVYDGTTELGSTTTTTGGAWSFTTSSLANGVHSFTAESQNSYGASASSIPIPITLTSLSADPGGGADDLGDGRGPDDDFGGGGQAVLRRDDRRRQFGGERHADDHRHRGRRDAVGDGADRGNRRRLHADRNGGDRHQRARRAELHAEGGIAGDELDHELPAERPQQRLCDGDGQHDDQRRRHRSAAVAPTITGTVAGQKTTSEAAVKPFSGVTIADANSGASDTLTITVTGAGGTLSGTGLTGGTGGVYTLTGTAATVTSELDALSFTPKAGSPGTSSTTNFQLSDLSSAYATATVNTTTSVVDTDPAAVAPTITGTVAGQKTTSEAAVKPFSGVTIADPNSGASDTLTITVTGAGGTLSGTGLTGGTGGVYTLAGTAAAITSELDALSFTPKAGSPGTSSTTNFQLSDLSSAYATATVNTTTSVVDTDPAGALSLSVAQATAMETAGGSAPSGDVVTLSDTAANIAGADGRPDRRAQSDRRHRDRGDERVRLVDLRSGGGVGDRRPQGFGSHGRCRDAVGHGGEHRRADAYPDHGPQRDRRHRDHSERGGHVERRRCHGLGDRWPHDFGSDVVGYGGKHRVADGDRNRRARRDRRHRDRGDERVGLV